MRLRLLPALIAGALLCRPLLVPGIGEDKPIWSHPPELHILDNGLKVVAQKDTASAVTVIRFLIMGGSAAEPADKKGVAHVATRLALEFPDRGKIQKLMGQATQISMTSRSDYSLIDIACLSENLEDCLELVSEIMLDPLFSGIRVDALKKNMNHRREILADDSINVCSEILNDRIFQGTPYAGSVFGTEDSLKNIKTGDVKDFYTRDFCAANMAVISSSDLDSSVLFQEIGKFFKDLPKGSPLELSVDPPAAIEPGSEFVEKDSNQSLVAVALPLPAVSPRTYVLAHMLDTLLGTGPNSRLWYLRTEKKLAYNVSSSVTLTRFGGGMLQVYLETDHEKRDEAMAELKAVFQSLKESALDPVELELTKIQYKSSLLQDSELKFRRTGLMAETASLGLGYDFPVSLTAEIEATTLEEMNDFIRKVLERETLLELLIGPGR